MVAPRWMHVHVDSSSLFHEDVERLAAYVHEHLDGNVVTIDLSGVMMTTTAAFARLLVLRKRLLAAGRDLQLTGLDGEVLSLYRILHMDRALPRSNDAGGRCENASVGAGVGEM